MPVFEGEDGAYEPVEMGLYKPYEVVVKFNAEDVPMPGSSCGSREPTSMSKLDEKTCLDMCGGEGWSWNNIQGCHPPARSNSQPPSPTPPSPEPSTAWYVQETVPSVPNWLLAGVGAVVLIGYFMFRKKEG